MDQRDLMIIIIAVLGSWSWTESRKITKSQASMVYLLLVTGPDGYMLALARTPAG